MQPETRGSDEAVGRASCQLTSTRVFLARVLVAEVLRLGGAVPVSGGGGLARRRDRAVSLAAERIVGRVAPVGLRYAARLLLVRHGAVVGCSGCCPSGGKRRACACAGGRAVRPARGARGQAACTRVEAEGGGGCRRRKLLARGWASRKGSCARCSSSPRAGRCTQTRDGASGARCRQKRSGSRSRDACRGPNARATVARSAWRPRPST